MGLRPHFLEFKMATFRCLQSGNTVTFTLQHDIDTMKGHAGYIRIDEEEVPERKDLPLTAPTPVRRPGRPRKVAEGV
jgi:hypothetical protein